MLDKAREEGFSVLADGSNADDIGDYRPGIRALNELGIKSPLKTLGFTKNEIRTFSKEAGLPTWNMQSYACLASRFPYGQKITPESLETVIRITRDEFQIRFIDQRRRAERVIRSFLTHVLLGQQMKLRIRRAKPLIAWTYDTRRLVCSVLLARHG